MGKSVPTFRRKLDKIESDWKAFRKALQREEKEKLDELFKKARLHASAAQYQVTPDPIEAVLLSIVLEQQKKLSELKEKIESRSQ